MSDKMVEEMLFCKRQWHQEAARAERLQNENIALHNALEAAQAAATIAERREIGLFDAIAHGDGEHRAWLKEAITAHFAGEPVPPPRGRGTAERRMEEMRAERDKWKQRAFQLERKHGDLKGVFVEARAALRPSGGV
jgi:hypothetical protein